MAGGDVTSSGTCSSDQLTTAVGSGASAMPCDSAWLARGVATSTCIGCPVTTSMGAAGMVGWVVGTTCGAAWWATRSLWDC